jgi:hypothetical protein
MHSETILERSLSYCLQISIREVIFDAVLLVAKNRQRRGARTITSDQTICSRVVYKMTQHRDPLCLFISKTKRLTKSVCVCLFGTFLAPIDI